MKKILLVALFVFLHGLVYSQNLYPEKYQNCNLASFCLDCGDILAMPPKMFVQEVNNSFDKKRLAEIKGVIEVQILIDESGKPCLISALNKTNVASKKLNLEKVINTTSFWEPAISENKPRNSSVSFIFEFEDGSFSVRRRVFDLKNQGNMKSVGTPEIKGTNEEKLSKKWQLFKQDNSELPWDMTRAIASDLDDNIWIGTDNGIVKIEKQKWQHFNSQNTNINPKAYNKNQTESVRDLEVDQENNKWFVIGWSVYKYDNKNWTKYDSINSPISWARKLFVDYKNNVWFTSWRGVAKFDGNKWSNFTKQNSDLPSDKTLGVYIDKKDRIWIGTFEGNVIIENGITKLLDDKKSPLSKAFISKIFEDKGGNLWFDLYNDKSDDAGIYRLDTLGNWIRIVHPNSKMFSENTINDFYLDETEQVLWLTLNGVGILCYDLKMKKWETYTNQNSNVPSIHSEKITKDRNGSIWVATYAGVVKTE